MAAIDDLLRAFALETVGPDCYRAQNTVGGTGVVFGGQLIGQSIVAGLLGQDGRSVKTVHTVFARGASSEAPLAITIDRMHAGRTLASSSVTISQGDRLCARSLVLLSADEPDFIRHADPPPPVPGPDDCKPVDHGLDAWEIRIVGDVDINDPELVGPPELDVWTRFVGAPVDPALSQALLAYATDGFLIGTAMRPHAGVGQARAHRTVSTGVLSHTLTFHEPFSAGDWHLLSHRSSYTGRGRCYGRANVFGTDGRLVAAFVQDGMIRTLPAPRGARGDRTPGVDV